ncbi:MAG: chemotaxis protein CheD [Candidatus Zixiibacteriota bacterium]
MKIVSIGEMIVSNDKDEVLKTFALGMSVALIIHDKSNNNYGLVHIALPNAKVNRKKAQYSPGHFADTAVNELLKIIKKESMAYKQENIEAKIIGGANVESLRDTFKIGKRTLLEVKKQLWKHKIHSIREDTGGNISRTVSIDISTGEVIVSVAGRGEWKI